MVRLFSYATLFALVHSRVETWPYHCPASMNVSDLNVSFDGKTVLVTGSNGHMGHIATLEAARRGAALVIASARTNAEAQKNKATLLKELAGINVSIQTMVADLSSMASVAAAARQFLAQHDLLDVVIHEAGGGNHPNVSADGFNEDVEINHLGPALLTELLIPALSNSAGARVVYLASERSFAYDWSKTTVADAVHKATTGWNLDEPEAASRSYSFSKFLVTQYAAEQARRRPDLTIFSVNPGYSALPSDPQWPLIIKACGDYIRTDPCPLLPQQGVTSAIFAAGQPQIESASGALIDFETTLFSNGTYYQSGETCVPRPLPGKWSNDDRGKWYNFVQSKLNVPHLVV